MNSQTTARISKHFFLKGFSLMEMMVVLLITAVVAAATAPMINRKLLQNQAENGSPWVFIQGQNSIAFDLNGKENAEVSIGAIQSGIEASKRPKLFIKTIKDSLKPQITLDDGNNNKTSIFADKDRLFITNNESIEEIKNLEKSSKSVIVGSAYIQGEKNTAVGYGAIANNTALAIGYQAGAYGKYSTAIGPAYFIPSIWQGPVNPTTGTTQSTADFVRTAASGDYSSAFGSGAKAGYERSTAIGADAETTAKNQIVLGTAADTVYIPGNLVVGGNTLLGINSNKYMVLRAGQGAFEPIGYEYASGVRLLQVNTSPSRTVGGFTLSDRRLKNVGKAFVGGLDEIKKLEVFNYTFKKDSKKTPRVGVMAQDLEKIFPNAVFKGDDGFLRIRMEDMFYALVNAVKELDKMVTELKNNEIRTLQTQVNELEKQNKELIKRIEKLEKAVKHVQ